VADTYGWILLQAGDARQALPLLQRAATDLDDPSTEYHYAVALARTGTDEEAKRRLTVLLQDTPGFPEAGVSTFGPVMIHGQLGDMELATLTPQLGRYFGTEKGVLVVRAPKDFKLEDGDVILAIDGREPSSGSHATRILSSYQGGEKITIKVMRQQKTVNVETTLPDRMSFMGSGPDRKVKLIRRGANATT